MSTKFLDTKDYIPGTSPLRRSFNVMFDRIVSNDKRFDFYIGQKFVCTVDKANFDFRMTDFFEGIADPR